MRLVGPALALIVLLTVSFLAKPQQAMALNCADFATQAAAQTYLRLYPWDPDRLDADGNGIACQNQLPCTCDNVAVVRVASSAQATTIASTGTPIPTVGGTQITPIPTATAIPATPQPGTGQFVGTPSGTTLTCPASREWLGLYWNGGQTPVVAAIKTCQTANLVWSRRGQIWRGYATDASNASDQFTIDIGEFVFVHGR